MVPDQGDLGRPPYLTLMVALPMDGPAPHHMRLWESCGRAKALVNGTSVPLQDELAVGEVQAQVERRQFIVVVVQHR